MMAEKNPIMALSQVNPSPLMSEESGPIGDKLRMIMSSLSCPGGNCKPRDKGGKKRYKQNKKRYNKKA